jgi:hypothetical protein
VLDYFLLGKLPGAPRKPAAQQRVESDATSD